MFDVCPCITKPLKLVLDLRAGIMSETKTFSGRLAHISHIPPFTLFPATAVQQYFSRWEMPELIILENKLPEDILSLLV